MKTLPHIRVLGKLMLGESVDPNDKHLQQLFKEMLEALQFIEKNEELLRYSPIIEVYNFLTKFIK